MPDVSAAVFTPSSSLFNNDLDGVWEFPNALQPIFVGAEMAQDWLTINFSDGMPENSQVDGYGVIESDGNTTFLRLNELGAPQYLVNNRFAWSFSLTQSQHVWLRLEYRLWSQETERGFDDPALVVYYDNALIYRESVFEHCAETVRVEGVCPWRTKRMYLGNVQGNHTLTILAGEMGDTEKPTGADIRAFKFETQAVAIGVTPTPTPTLILTPVPTNPITPTPAPTIISQVESSAPAITIIQQPAEIIERERVVYAETDSGAVLGVSDQGITEKSNEPEVDIEEILRPYMLKTWLILALGIGLPMVGAVGWRIYQLKFMKH